MEAKKYKPEDIYPAPQEENPKENQEKSQEAQNNEFILEEYKVIRKGKSEILMPVQFAFIFAILTFLPIVGFIFGLFSMIFITYSLKSANKFEIETGKKSQTKIWAEILFAVEVGFFAIYLISSIFAAGGMLNRIKLF